MSRKRKSTSNTINNQGTQVTQKEKKKSPENKLKDMEIRDLSDRFRIAVLKNSTKYEKMQISSLMNSENESMNKTSTLPRRLKL